MNLYEDRRALHRIPELSKDLPLTLAYIHNALKELRCEVLTPAESSICAYFDFGKAATLAFRADMDALPVTENTGLSFASCHPGKMHACGHDGHMAMALELARRVNQAKDLPHNVLIVFQPAEETLGGAKDLCLSGVFEQYNTRAIFGLHLWPDLPVGTISSIPGGMMCRSSEVTLTVTGRSAHVGRASEGLDAMEAAVRWYQGALALERALPDEAFRLLKFGKFTAGVVRNALAGSAVVEGTLRALEDSVFDSLKNGLDRLAEEIAKDTGCTLELHYSDGYPAVWNDSALLEQVEKIYPVKRLEHPALITEDFSWYQRFLPGVFSFVGCGPAPALHSNDFHFDEKALEVGADFLWRIAEALEWN